MNIIDALVVQFKADNSDLNRGFDDSARKVDKFGDQSNKQSKRVTQQSKQMAQGYRNVRNEISGLLALSLGAGGIGTLMSKTFGDQSELGRLSQTLKMSARDLDAWGRSMGQVGGTIEDARQSMKAIQQGQISRSLGQDSPVVSVLMNLGVPVSNDEGEMRAPAQILRDLAGNEKFQGENEARQMRIGQMLGLTEKMTYFLRQGPEAVDRQLSEAQRNSNVTRGSTEQAQRAQKAFNELSQSINGVWQTIFISLAPAMDDLNSLMGEFGDWLRENRPEIEEFFSSLVTGVSDAIGNFRDFNDATDGVAGNLLGIAAGLTALKVAMGGLRMLTAVATGGLLGGRKEKKGGKGAGGIFKGGLGGVLLATQVPGIAKWIEDMAMKTEAGRNLEKSLPRPITGAQNAWERAKAQIESTGKRKGSFEKAVEYFTSSGWSRDQAIGIAANLQRESNFDPKAVGDGGKAYGIAQWHPARQEDFRRQYGKSIKDSTFQDQLAFVNHEMLRGKEMRAGNALMAAQTSAQAASIVSKQYERPAATEKEAMRRAAVARGYANLNQPEFESKKSRPNSYTQGMRVGASSSPSVTDNSNRVSNSTRNDTRIERIDISTAAQDAAALVSGLREGLESHPLLDYSAMGQY